LSEHTALKLIIAGAIGALLALAILVWLIGNPDFIKRRLSHDPRHMSRRLCEECRHHAAGLSTLRTRSVGLRHEREKG